MITALPLKRYLFQNNISIEELSLRTSISVYRLAAFLDDKSSSVSCCFDICRALNCGIENVIEWRTNPLSKQEEECYICKPLPLTQDEYGIPLQQTETVSEDGTFTLSFTPINLKKKIAKEFKNGTPSRILAEKYGVTESRIKTWSWMYDE